MLSKLFNLFVKKKPKQPIKTSQVKIEEKPKEDPEKAAKDAYKMKLMREYEEYNSRLSEAEHLIDRYRYEYEYKTVDNLYYFLEKYEAYRSARNDFHIKWNIFVESVINPRSNKTMRNLTKSKYDQAKKEYEKYKQAYQFLYDEMKIHENIYPRAEHTSQFVNDAWRAGWDDPTGLKEKEYYAKYENDPDTYEIRDDYNKERKADYQKVFDRDSNVAKDGYEKQILELYEKRKNEESIKERSEVFWEDDYTLPSTITKANSNSEFPEKEINELIKNFENYEQKELNLSKSVKEKIKTKNKDSPEKIYKLLSELDTIYYQMMIYINAILDATDHLKKIDFGFKFNKKINNLEDYAENKSAYVQKQIPAMETYYQQLIKINQILNTEKENHRYLGQDSNPSKKDEQDHMQSILNKGEYYLIPQMLHSKIPYEEISNESNTEGPKHQQYLKGEGWKSKLYPNLERKDFITGRKTLEKQPKIKPNLDFSRIIGVKTQVSDLKSTDELIQLKMLQKMRDYLKADLNDRDYGWDEHVALIEDIDNYLDKVKMERELPSKKDAPVNHNLFIKRRKAVDY